jgi:hypothetical protein
MDELRLRVSAKNFLRERERERGSDRKLGETAEQRT